MNVKHILGKLVELAIGSEIIKINSQRYCTKVVDLFEWTPPRETSEEKGDDTAEIGAGMLVFNIKKIVYATQRIVARIVILPS